MIERDDNRFMEFRLNSRLYAMPLLQVKEVIPRPEFTAVPNMPTHFEGMFNLRGQILGVFNVRKRLSEKNKDSSDQSREVVIVMEFDGLSVGMIVDEVTRVLHPKESDMKPAPVSDDDPSRRYMAGVIQSGTDLVVIIKPDQLVDMATNQASKKAA
jgi:purine-binding chemotaxis protein CheW